MKKQSSIFILAMFFLVLTILFAIAHGEDTFTEAEEIIKQKISCDNITEEQLEILGDYYMEQMHPGELHEIMDERMGGEGSENLKQVHINMGLAFYCGEHQTFSAGMMDVMMGRNAYGNMMYGGMTGNYYNNKDNSIFSWLFYILLIIGLVLLIILLVKQIGKKNKRR